MSLLKISVMPSSARLPVIGAVYPFKIVRRNRVERGLFSRKYCLSVSSQWDTIFKDKFMYDQCAPLALERFTIILSSANPNFGVQ